MSRWDGLIVLIVFLISVAGCIRPFLKLYFIYKKYNFSVREYSINKSDWLEARKHKRKIVLWIVFGFVVLIIIAIFNK